MRVHDTPTSRKLHQKLREIINIEHSRWFTICLLFGITVASGSAFIAYPRIAKRSRQEVSQQGLSLPRQQSGASSSLGWPSVQWSEEGRWSFLSENSACVSLRIDLTSPPQHELLQLLFSFPGAMLGTESDSEAWIDGLDMLNMITSNVFVVG